MDDQDLPNVSNNLYAHVEEYDFSGEAGDLKQSFVSCNDIAIFQDGVMKLVKHVQVNKAQRPDEVCKPVLHFCSVHLGGVFQHLQFRFRSHSRPVEAF